jgi:hypothetical protein
LIYDIYLLISATETLVSVLTMNLLDDFVGGESTRARLEPELDRYWLALFVLASIGLPAHEVTITRGRRIVVSLFSGFALHDMRFVISENRAGPPL